MNECLMWLYDICASLGLGFVLLLRRVTNRLAGVLERGTGYPHFFMYEINAQGDA
jgi:hypothetical protein